MERQITVFRVFIASPNDLGDERAALREIVNEINGVFSRETELRLELLGWEDTMPGGGRPQELINVDVDKADLFVGCLWRRWGTPAGKGGKTGFEEEFDRAFERHTKTGEPEIWLFFKEVSEEQRKDPGEQLMKVLAFREREEKAKRLLFQQFVDANDWKQRIAPLLSRQLLRLTKRSLEQKEAQGPQSNPNAASAASAAAPSAQTTKAPGITSVVTLLKSVADGLTVKTLAEFRASSAFENSQSIRLLLFAASLYSQKVQSVEFGTHETNSAFWHRQKIKPTGQERLFLIKTALMDGSVTKPGWYWASRWQAKMSFWLPWLIRFDGDDAIRVEALRFATNTAFPLHGESTDKVIYAALNDGNKSVQLAGLAYLAEHGTAATLAELRKISSGPDEELRREAKDTEHAIRLRLNTDKELNKLLEQAVSPSQRILKAIFTNIQRVATGTLQKCLNHTNPKLRAAAAAELLRRSSLTLPAALQLVSDDSRPVKEQGFYGLINHSAAPPPAEIRSQLAGFRPYRFAFSEESVDPDGVIEYYFSKQPAEKLWEAIILMDQDSAIALRALGERFASHRKVIRDALIDDFEQQVAAAKSLRAERSPLGYISFLGEDPIEAVRRKLRTAALETLADRPEPLDRALFQRFLSSEISAINQTIACLRGISAIGNNDDTAFVTPFLSSSSGSVQAAAARALLLLSAERQTAVQQALSLKSKYAVCAVVASELKQRDPEAWKQLKPLLSDANDDVRRLVSYYAVSVLTRRDMLALLNEYLRGGWYYYNVVTLLDRALYAPPNVRTYFREQEKKYFAKLAGEATHRWPGLLL